MSDDFDDFEIPDYDGDMADVPDSNDPPPATYLVNIEKMEMKSRKDDKTVKFINIQFKIVDVLDEALEGFIGRSLFDIFNLGATSLWKIKGVWSACRGGDNVKGSRIPNLTGDTLKLTAYIDTYGGQENLRTKGYKSKDGWVGITMDLNAVDDDDDDEETTNKSSNKSSSGSGQRSEQSTGEVEI